MCTFGLWSFCITITQPHTHVHARARIAMPTPTVATHVRLSDSNLRKVWTVCMWNNIVEVISKFEYGAAGTLLHFRLPVQPE